MASSLTAEIAARTPKHVLLFGDASGEKLSAIQELVRSSRTIPAARRFLQEATTIVQSHFKHASVYDHGWEHGTESLLSMAERHEEERGDNIVVSGVLLCIGRLGKLIVYAEEDPSVLGSSIDSVEVVALCAGLLPASVAIAATDTSRLFSFGREVISITFRLALEMRSRMKLIEPARFQTWGKTFTGISEAQVQVILDDFHESQNVPRLRKIAVALVASNWLTLIGPPSTLAALEAWSRELRAAPQLDTPVPGPIHSNYLPQTNTAKILGTFSGVPYKHKTWGSLLEEAIQDIMHNPLYLTDTIEASVAELDPRRKVSISVMGQTNAVAAVKMALKAKSIEFSQRDIAMKPEINGSDLVAIVGMAGRFPGSETVEGFWEDLLASKCHIKEVPKSRFDIDEHFDPTGVKMNSTTARHGAWLENPGLFDHRLFNISPREAAQMDPGHRLLLTISYEALQSAGYTPEGSDGTRVATYFGQAADDWWEILNQRGADICYVSGANRAFGPARLNFHYKWSGGSYALDSACSTSATAISLACSALLARECNMALAGGVSVLVSPITFSGLSKAGMLSTTGGCRTFHDNADGYARGEGAGTVVLKRLDDAIANNDNILGVIRGSARTYSSTASSMTRPDLASQRATYDEVLRRSCLDPAEIAYVEMHGTGTQAGDETEMKSVIDSFAKRRSKDNQLTVGAVKASVGHGEASASVIALIKALMMLKEGMIPPQPGWPFQLNHKFPVLTELNVRVSTKALPLKPSPKGDKRIKLLVNSFDASGGNVALAIEEAPARPAKSPDSRGWHLVAISARSATSLLRNRENLLDFLQRNPETKLSDLAYTTTARRIHESLRCAYVGNSTRDIVRQLRDDVKKQLTAPKRNSRNQTCIFVCSGQGSTYSGMGAVLFRDCSAFRDSLLEYQEMATGLGLPHFLDLLSNPAIDMAKQSPAKVQLAIVGLEIGIAHLLKTWDITPTAVIGHSLGEYAALVISGVLSVSDALLLVGSRAMLMEQHLEADAYAMLVANLPVGDLEQHIAQLSGSSCTIACVNSSSATVVSGNTQDVKLLQTTLESTGAKTTYLQVPYGFHSLQVEPILGEFEALSKGVAFAKPAIPIISTLTGRVEQDASAFSPAYLVQQTRQPVNFLGALEGCKNARLCDENTLWLEIGPKPALSGLVRHTLDVPVSNLLPSMTSSENNWQTIAKLLQRCYERGISVNWPEFHKPFLTSLTLLNLPLYAFDSQDFWTPYAGPPTRIEGVAAGSVSPKVVQKQHLLSNSSLRLVEDEIIKGSQITVTLSTSLSDPHLLDAINGHVVDGHAICPLAVFNDLALSAAKYVHGKLHHTSKLPSMSIRNVEMAHALIPDSVKLESSVRVTASYGTGDEFVVIQFSSRQGKTTINHGNCQVAFGEGSAWVMGLSQTLFLLHSRIDTLRDQATVGKAHRLLKPVTYSLFSSVVAYSPRYQALEEVIMDTTCSDAVGTVILDHSLGSDGFHQSPYWTDGVVHLAGFVLNSSLKYPSDVACLAVGFESWRSVVDLVPGETYTSYVCMQEVPNSHLVTGDCYVFHGRDLVQATLGIKFLRVKKAAFQDTRPQAQVTRRESPHVKALRDVVSDVSEVLSPTPHRHEPALTFDTRRGNFIDTIKAVMSVVAAETGCSLDDMTEDARYADLGVDSVIAITIFTMLSKKVGLDLPATFFMDNETIGASKTALREYLGAEVTTEEDEEGEKLQPAPREESMVSSTPTIDTPASSKFRRSSVLSLEPQIELRPIPEAATITVPSVIAGVTAKIVHYQGSRSATGDKLFFIADEFGSTFAYIHLPLLGSNVSVYGVDSPFGKSPADMHLDIKQLVEVYIAAMRREQPSGPYFLGGISAGAVFAFEIARVLLEAGEEVKGLFILDSESPRFDGISRVNTKQKPSATEHARKIVAMFAAHDAIVSDSLLLPSWTLQVAAKGHKDTVGLGWGSVVSNIQVKETDIEIGAFLKRPTIDEVGRILKNAMEISRP